MENKNDDYADLVNHMRNGNLTVLGLLTYMEGHHEKLMQMPDSVFIKYKKYYEQIQSDQLYFEKNKKHKLSDQERGKFFEQLVGCLFFSENKFFNKAVNCRTSTNEIDLLIDWTDIAIKERIDLIYSFMGRSFLCECKNYENGVNVTYVGKFISLLRVNESKSGIIFTTSRIKGKGKWDSARGLIKKVALKEDVYIVDITWSDLTKIYNNEADIMSIIRDKYNALKNDIEYETYIKKHDLEDKFILAAKEKE